MSAGQSAQLLRRVYDRLRLQLPLAGQDAASLAAGLQRYFESGCTLDQAFGVQLDRGERHPGTSDALTRRDDALRAAGAKLGADGSTARILGELLARYERTAWRHDCTAEACPPKWIGQINADLWAALKANPRVVGESQIRKILAQSAPG